LLKPLKIAIVGCGRIADAHVEAVNHIDSATVVACCDTESLMAEQLAMRYSIQNHYDDFGDMLSKEQPDVVHITTPPASHLCLAATALDAGCHVFVEKPLALDYAETCKLLSAARSAGKKLTSGHIYQFDPAAAQMRRLIAEGAIGTPVHVESFYGYNLRGPFGSALLREPDHWVHRLPGKLLHNVIDHLINKIVEFVPDATPEIHASGYRHGETGPPFYTELRAIIRGTEVSAYATFSSRIRPEEQFLRVYGTTNSLLVNYVSRTVTLDSSPRMPSMIGRLTPPFADSWQFFKSGGRNIQQFMKSEFHFFAGLRQLLIEFYDSIRNDTEPPIAYADLLRTSWVMDQIFSQLESQA
jgi:predicted dehydrogenase